MTDTTPPNDGAAAPQGPATQPGKTGSEKSGAPIPTAMFENEQIFAAFENSVVQRVNQRLDDKLARRQATYIGALAIIVTLITGGGALFVGELLNLQITTQVRDQIDQQAERIQSADFYPRVASLEIRLQRMNAASGVDPRELDRALDEFEELYSRNVVSKLLSDGRSTESTSQTSSDTPHQQLARTRELELANSFDLLVQIVAALDRVSEAERLGELAPSLAIQSDVAMQALAQSYGRQIIGAAGAPESWTEGQPFHATFLKYREWSTRARENRYPELFYVFEAIIWHIEDKSLRDVMELLQDVDDLNDVDGNAYQHILQTLATEEIVQIPTALSGRIAERVRDFIDTYSDRSIRVAAVADAISQ